MSLFRRASQVAKKFKICVYGPPGSGKTILGLTFPKPVVIDMEAGTDWYVGRSIVEGQANDFDVLHTNSAKDVIDAIREVEQESKKDPDKWGSIIIDPVTIFWDALQDGFLKKLRAKQGANAEIKFQHWKQIKNPYKSAMTTLLNLPMHLVLSGREAHEYKMEKGELIQVGQKIQSEKDTPYIADIYLRTFTRRNSEGVEEFFVEVEKDRTHLLKKGSVIKDCSFQKLSHLQREAGIGLSGEHRAIENDSDIADKDGIVFDEEVVDDTKNNVAEIIEKDEDIVKLWKELDWKSGKVLAMANRDGLTTREEIGKFLAAKVREQRSK